MAASKHDRGYYNQATLTSIRAANDRHKFASQLTTILSLATVSGWTNVDILLSKMKNPWAIVTTKV